MECFDFWRITSSPYKSHLILNTQAAININESKDKEMLRMQLEAASLLFQSQHLLGIWSDVLIIMLMKINQVLVYRCPLWSHLKKWNSYYIISFNNEKQRGWIHNTVCKEVSVWKSTAHYLLLHKNAHRMLTFRQMQMGCNWGYALHFSKNPHSSEIVKMLYYDVTHRFRSQHSLTPWNDFHKRDS